MTFVRLDWGGIQTDDAGRDALVKTRTVLDFLRDDYASVREEDRLAICRVQEIVVAMQARETETREDGGTP